MRRAGGAVEVNLELLLGALEAGGVPGGAAGSLVLVCLAHLVFGGSYLVPGRELRTCDAADGVGGASGDARGAAAPQRGSRGGGGGGDGKQQAGRRRRRRGGAAAGRVRRRATEAGCCLARPRAERLSDAKAERVVLLLLGLRGRLKFGGRAPRPSPRERPSGRRGCQRWRRPAPSARRVGRVSRRAGRGVLALHLVGARIHAERRPNCLVVIDPNERAFPMTTMICGTGSKIYEGSRPLGVRYERVAASLDGKCSRTVAEVQRDGAAQGSSPPSSAAAE